MAEGGSARKQLIILERGEIEEIIQCPICLQHYDDDQHLPKFLECHHTVCIACLRLLLSRDVTSPISLDMHKRCPQCRVNIDVASIERVPASFYVQQVRGLLGRNRPAESLSAVAASPPEEVSTQRTTSIDNCQTHPNFPTIMWCSTCCVLMCPICLYEEHPRSHQVTHIDEVRETSKRTATSLLEELMGRNSEMEAMVEGTLANMDRLIRSMRTKVIYLKSLGYAKYHLVELFRKISSTISEGQEISMKVFRNHAEQLTEIRSKVEEFRSANPNADRDDIL